MILWAPWRMKYIEDTLKEREKKCFLCEAATIEDIKSRFVLYRDSRVVVVMNLFPYNTGHLLIAPVKHVPSIVDLDDDELLSLSLAVKGSVVMLSKALKPEGFNIGVNLGRVAGAGLEDHVHVHVVPRWCGDTNFMPLIGGTKVMPESLGDTYRRLLKEVSILGDMLKR